MWKQQVENENRSFGKRLESIKNWFRKFWTSVWKILLQMWFKFLKKLSLFKRKSYILWKLLISFRKENQILKMCWHPKHVYLENMAWVLTPKANKVRARNLFQLSLKNNRLKNWNNQLFVVSIAWKMDTLLGSAESESLLSLRVFWNGFLRCLMVLGNTLTPMDPNSQGDQI